MITTKDHTSPSIYQGSLPEQGSVNEAISTQRAPPTVPTLTLTSQEQTGVSLGIPTQQEQATVYKPTQQKKTTVYTSEHQKLVTMHRSKLNQSTEYTLRHQDQMTLYTSQHEWTTLSKPRHQETTLHTPTPLTPEGRTGAQRTTERVAYIVNLTTEDVIGCLSSNSESIVVKAEEVWLSLAYTGNMSGSPRLRKPSRCWLQVYGLSQGIMSMLIVNVTCFTDNRLVVVSGLRGSGKYNCDPTAWLAPGIELVTATMMASVDIQINNVNTPFSIEVQFQMVPHKWRRKLELRWVTRYLGEYKSCSLLILTIGTGNWL